MTLNDIREKAENEEFGLVQIPFVGDEAMVIIHNIASGDFAAVIDVLDDCISAYEVELDDWGKFITDGRRCYFTKHDLLRYV